MTWRVYVFMAFILSVLTVMQFVNEANDSWITLIAVVHCSAMLVIMKIKRHYYLVAIITGVMGLIINQLNIFTVLNGERFVDLLWVLVVTFYMFYALGARWGIWNLVANFVGFFIFLIFIPQDLRHEAILNRNPTAEADIIINAVVTVSVICYLLAKIAQATKHAEQNYIDANLALKKQNDLVVAQNEEKSVLLREIHHRVKNNLQIISSLLKLQAGDSGSEETESQLNEAINRIRSMALIHEKMYGGTDLAHINLQDYLQSLIDDIVKSHASDKRIATEIVTDIDRVNINTLVPLALIFNELTTNALKHGFRNRDKGVIRIRIGDDEDDRSTIHYADDGEWLARDKEEGFGTVLIDTFTEQLEGHYERDTTHGTSYYFRFANLRQGAN